MPVNYADTLGQVIKKKRLHLGLSLRDLAKKVGVHHATIDRIEMDRFKVIDPAILMGIADALHLDKMYLLSLGGANVGDQDLRLIARAQNRMTDAQRRQMMDMLRAAFPEAFKNIDSDDLDENRY